MSGNLSPELVIDRMRRKVLLARRALVGFKAESADPVLIELEVLIECVDDALMYADFYFTNTSPEFTEALQPGESMH